MSEIRNKRIPLRERHSLLQSLRAGVTPRTGLRHIQVGRVKEVNAMLMDLDRIADGGSSFRLIIGEYGSGKSFFLHLIRSIALEKGFVTIHADLSPDKRLHSTSGLARRLYNDLMISLSTRTKPDGNALTNVTERFITEARKDADSSGKTVSSIIQERLNCLSELVGGYDFASVIDSYWRGHEKDDSTLQSNAIRWLRGEFSTKTEARHSLGVRYIVHDDNIYDFLKLMSLFIKQAGYSGLLIHLDEMVNLYKLSSRKARISNYEQVLRILNDCLQGSSSYIGFLMGGTPDLLFDPRRGLFSYEALHSRLMTNSFAQKAGVTDYTAPSLHLPSLEPEEVLVLLRNLRHVFAYGDTSQYLVPDEALSAFLEHCSRRIGDAYFKTPRDTVKTFTDFLSVLEQHKDKDWRELLPQISLKKDPYEDTSLVEKEIENSDTDQLVAFRL